MAGESVLLTVGGSGQHVALAVSRLVAIGALKRRKLLALDADNEGDLSKTLAKQSLLFPHRYQAGDAAKITHPLGDGQVRAPFRIGDIGSEVTFAQLFVNPNQQFEEERHLFEALFTSDLGSTRVHKGMYGRPSVGATVFAEGASSLGAHLSPLVGADSITVCGSVVGGTGAGVIHKLVQQLRGLPYPQESIFGIFLLPWFAAPPGAGDADGTINEATIARNTEHGVTYFYEHTIPKLALSVLLGRPADTGKSELLKPVQVKRGNMGEYPSFLHVAAAWSLTKVTDVGTADPNLRVVTIAHDLAREGWLLDEKWESDLTLRRRIRAHRVLKKYLDFLVSEGGAIVEYYAAEGGFFSGVTRMTRSRDAWGKVLHETMTQNQPSEKHLGEYARQLLGAWTETRDRLASITEYFEGIFTTAILEESGDVLLTGPATWPDLIKFWSKSLKPDPGSRKYTAAEAAEFHAEQILHFALASRN